MDLQDLKTLAYHFAFRSRKGHKMTIKSWRVWIEFNDGDWHAETLQSLNAQQRQNILTRIKDGYEVWPWPNDGTPSDRVKVATPKQLHMVSKEQTSSKANNRL